MNGIPRLFLLAVVVTLAACESWTTAPEPGAPDLSIVRSDLGTPAAEIASQSAKIAFQSQRDGNEEVYLMNADGTGQTNLTNAPGFDGEPSWSPDGSMIMFTSDRGGNRDVYAMNADGSGVINLSNDPAADGSGGWSPDGTKIAFHSNRTGNYEIFVANADGTSPTQMTFTGASEFNPQWSPDGTRIAFWSNRDPGHGDFSVYTMNPDGTGVSSDLYVNSVEDYTPTWSPDGGKIVFWSGVGQEHDVIVMNADGSSPVNLTAHPGDDTHPHISPDGTQIVFATNRNGSYQICLMGSTGGAVNCITTNAQGNNYFARWQPVLTVDIDVKPGSFPNSINPTGQGLIPVAILSTADFDATAVDPLSVRFGPAGAEEAHGKGHVEDVDGDGDLDLVLHFRTQASGIACGDVSVELVGQTAGGQPVQGSDSVETVGCH